VSYSYGSERARVFTEEGQVMLLAIRDNARDLLKAAGAFRFHNVIKARGVSGDSWLMLACVDRLIELQELCRIVVGARPSDEDVYVAGPSRLE